MPTHPSGPTTTVVAFPPGRTTATSSRSARHRRGGWGGVCQVGRASALSDLRSGGLPPNSIGGHEKGEVTKSTESTKSGSGSHAAALAVLEPDGPRGESGR